MIPHPHGDCECDGPCRCSTPAKLVQMPGPAAYRIERDGRTLHVCTRCTQPDDTNVQPIATLSEIPLYREYDPTGARVLSRLLRPTATTAVN